MYELMCIIPAIYTAEELDPVIGKLESLLKEQGAEVSKSENLGNLKFAYTISKNTNGYYVTFDFNCDAENLKKLNRALQLDKSVIRFTIVKKSKNAISAKPVEFKKIEPGQRPRVKREFIRKSRGEDSKKIKIEDIDDKKLDEILKKEIV